jgi:hypothetical protein
MLYGMHTCLALFDGGATRNIDYVIYVGIYRGSSFQVYALEFKAMVGFGRSEGHGRGYARMQAYA